jgi:uncharacterized protein YwbE
MCKNKTNEKIVGFAGTNRIASVTIKGQKKSNKNTVIQGKITRENNAFILTEATVGKQGKRITLSDGKVLSIKEVKPPKERSKKEEAVSAIAKTA